MVVGELCEGVGGPTTMTPGRVGTAYAGQKKEGR